MIITREEEDEDVGVLGTTFLDTKSCSYRLTSSKSSKASLRRRKGDLERARLAKDFISVFRWSYVEHFSPSDKLEKYLVIISKLDETYVLAQFFGFQYTSHITSVRLSKIDQFPPSGSSILLLCRPLSSVVSKSRISKFVCVHHGGKLFKTPEVSDGSRGFQGLIKYTPLSATHMEQAPKWQKILRAGRDIYIYKIIIPCTTTTPNEKGMPIKYYRLQSTVRASNDELTSLRSGNDILEWTKLKTSTMIF